jgi:cyclopropane fatty-acyl-phospholipid synthase-like methyltransferase
MNYASDDVLGSSMLAYWKKQDDSPFRIKINGYEEPPMPPSAFFRGYNQMRDYEKKALKLVRGKVLDVGCGAGCHSLYLQKKGHEVHGLEISDLIAQVAEERGVTVYKEDWRSFSKKGYDTILALMNGMGMISEIQELAAFFKKLKSLLSPDGQIIIDSTDVSYARSNWEFENPDYFGHVFFQLQYKRKKQEFFWIFVDLPTAKKAAKAAKLNAEVISEEPGGHYLLRLTKVR